MGVGVPERPHANAQNAPRFARRLFKNVQTAPRFAYIREGFSWASGYPNAYTRMLKTHHVLLGSLLEMLKKHHVLLMAVKAFRGRRGTRTPTCECSKRTTFC